MNIKNKNFIIPLSILFVFATWMLPKGFAKANVFIFPPTITTASATSSLIAIAPGLATTTLVYDSYNTGQPLVTENAVLSVLDTASSSASVLKISLQYSQNGVDWYGDDISAASTSALQNFNSYTYSATSLTASTTGFALPIITPLRFVRVIFTSTGATNAIYAGITPRRQIPGGQ